MFWVARLEGVSLLVLFVIAMPVKYGLDEPLLVEVCGWAHGLLFLAFVAGLGVGLTRLGWSLAQVALGFVSAFLPFGTFLWERQVAPA